VIVVAESQLATFDDLVAALVSSVQHGTRHRIVAPGGMGKSHVLGQVTERLGTDAVSLWSAAIDPDRLPSTDRVLLADDVHLAGVAAVRALARHEGGVIVAHRPCDGPVAGLLDAIDGTPLVLEPLGHDELRAMLTAQWGDPPPTDVVESLLIFSAGTPRLALAAGVTGPVAEPGPTRALAHTVRNERRRLSPAGRALLVAAAVLDGLDLAVLAEASGIELAQAVFAAEELAAAGLALDTAARLVPAVAATVRLGLSSSHLRVLADQAASAALAGTGDLVAIADRIHAIGTGGPEAARCLLLAAHQKLVEQPERAHSWVAAAGTWDAPPVDRAAVQALVSFQRGDARATVTAVDDMLRDSSGQPRSLLHHEALEAAAVVLGAQGAWARCAELAEAVGSTGDNGVALAVLGWLAVGDVAAARRAFQSCSGGGPSGIRGAAGLAVAQGLLATVADDVSGALRHLLEAARLHDLAAPRRPPSDDPHVLAAIVACQLWELDIAAEVLTETVRTGRATSQRRHDLLSAWVAMRRGESNAARAIMERANKPGQRSGDRDALLALAVEAGVARRHGDLDAMLLAWRRARTLLLRVPPDLLVLQPVGELLIAGARLGDRGTVQTYLAGVRQLLARAGDPPLWSLSAKWDEVHIAIALDDLDAARTAAKAADALPWLGPRTAAIADAAVCWVNALTGAPNPDHVRTSARALTDAGLAWEAARLAGGAAIRVPDSGQMRSLLHYARELSAPQAAALGGRAGGLSPREREVAGHLLAGRTYREIGAQLFIAPKTVEHHVARIRRRLGVESRSELLLALRSYVPAPAPS
jgi:DNA-binding CsgD family transcriptional regulator